MNKNIIKSDINKEMKSRYLDYAMSVIVGRALPDIRDGLKPVHRRILYAMYELGLSPDKNYRKCARIVGDVLGKYHPHGDTSVYDALVRMAQDFSMNHTLVDGHGNFGSIDGDSPAAMRYTEAKMDKIALEMLRDINKDTIDFIDNFDGTEKEPSVLPSRFPNLLVNGSEGIAVGMATHIPPHNLSEVINAIIYLIDNENSTIQDIMKFIPAPDFPTKGNIINTNDIYNAYSTGKGSVTIRGNYHIENNDNLKQIVFTEIPYQVNKNTLINSISKIVLKEKIFKNVIDVRDESDREGMRIVIEIKKNQNEDVILTKLFQKTSLEKKQSIILLTIVNNQPKILNLKEILNYYIEFQKEIITKRTKFDLNKAQQRLHILEGLKKATLNIDNTIKLIKNSKNKNEANNKLMTNLKIDKIQANAILELKLQRLTGLEIEILQQELNELQNKVKYLNNILENENQLLNVLKKEILEIKEKYNKPRQSEILYEHEIIEVDEEDMIEDYSTYIILTKEGYLKKLKKKSDNVKLKDEDVILKEMYSTNKSTLLLFSNKGICYKIYEYELEECKPSNLGEYLPQLLQLDKDEIIINIITTEEDYKGFLINCFKNGKIAKIDLSAFKTKTKRSKLENAYNIESELINQFKIEKDIDILCQSSINKILIINTSNINAKNSKNTKGNNILKSKKGSYMKECIPLEQIDLEQINDIEYYRGKPNAVGNFLKKEDKIVQI